MKAAELWKLSAGELGEILRGGHAIDPEALAGCSYRGVSLGLPSIVIRVTWLTFRKVFRRDPRSGKLVGHNERLEQTGLDGPVRPALKKGKPIVFGPYEVIPLPADGTPFQVHRGLLLDYGRGHPPLHPLARVRDPIVALEVGSHALLLGATYLDLPLRPLKTPSFFTLELEPAVSSVAPIHGER